MTATREDVRREFNKLLAFVPSVAGDIGGVRFRDGRHDAVEGPLLVQIGDQRADDLRTADERARKLVAEWLVVRMSDRSPYETAYIERVEELLASYLSLRAAAQRRPPPLPVYCAWCDRRLADGRTRAEVAACDAEREAIERELGLRPS